MLSLHKMYVIMFKILYRFRKGVCIMVVRDIIDILEGEIICEKPFK